MLVQINVLMGVSDGQTVKIGMAALLCRPAVGERVVDCTLKKRQMLRSVVRR